MKATQDAITSAQVSLVAHESVEFEISCQKASDQVGDLSEVVLRERQDKEAFGKVESGRDIIAKSAALFREVETDAEILGIAGRSAAYDVALSLCTKVLDDVKVSEVSCRCCCHSSFIIYSSFIPSLISKEE
jgi:hypothetical protein